MAWYGSHVSKDIRTHIFPKKLARFIRKQKVHTFVKRSRFYLQSNAGEQACLALIGNKRHPW